MKIEFEIEGTQELLNSLTQVQRGLVDFRDLGTWNAVQSEFYKVQKEIFAAEGPGWKELSHPYAEIKQAKYGNKPILQATGKMYAEFSSDKGNVDKQAQSMSFTFSQPAGFHMSKGARSKMPYRSSLDLTNDQEQRVTEPIIKKLKQLIDNAKLRDYRNG